MSELEYTGITQKLARLDERFTVRGACASRSSWARHAGALNRRV